MFEIGDYVVNVTNGICKIDSTLKMDLSGSGVEKEYFLLVPIKEASSKVYIPVETAETRMRHVMTEDEAKRVVNTIPEVEALVVENEKLREATYKEAIKSTKPEQLVGILKTLYRRRNERLAQGKNTTAVDDRYFKMAENQLHGELAFVLGMDKAEIPAMIAEVCE